MNTGIILFINDQGAIIIMGVLLTLIIAVFGLIQAVTHLMYHWMSKTDQNHLKKGLRVLAQTFGVCIILILLTTAVSFLFK
ncbi:MAG: hypothetical protein RLZZ306_2571 [Bacteroidota bacterium]